MVIKFKSLQKFIFILMTTGLSDPIAMTDLLAITGNDRLWLAIGGYGTSWRNATDLIVKDRTMLNLGQCDFKLHWLSVTPAPGWQ